MDFVDLTLRDTLVRIAPDLGCALTAFTLRERSILRPTPPAALAERRVGLTACYPLLPYSNRIRDARLRFGAREYTLVRNFGTHPHAIHGVGWQRAWTTAEAAPRDARFVLRHGAQGAEAGAWPWPFVATQTFHLAETAAETTAAPPIVLVVTLTLANAGTAAFPFGLGWHPFFPKDATTRVGFRADRVWRNDATQLPLRQVAIPRDWRFDPPCALGALELDNVFTGWRGTASIRSEATGVAVTLEADRACACLVVYAPPGGDFVALEPVTHETDAFNRAAAGARDTGMRILPPGGVFSCTMRIVAAIAGSQR
jgi:aldose 1-epimerase